MPQDWFDPWLLTPSFRRLKLKPMTRAQLEKEIDEAGGPPAGEGRPMRDLWKEYRAFVLGDYEALSKRPFYERNVRPLIDREQFKRLTQEPRKP